MASLKVAEQVAHQRGTPSVTTIDVGENGSKG